VWDIPWGSNLTGVTGAVLKGWQFSGIFTAQSGQPLYVSQDGDTLNVDDSGGDMHPDLVSGQDPILPGDQRTINQWFNTAAFVRTTDSYGTSPRNPVVGPGLKTLDTSLAKSFTIVGQQRLQFRWEMFNALNTVNWNNPTTTLGNANFGRITSARDARSMQLSLKYMF
jgi:hypothetical protein